MGESGQLSEGQQRCVLLPALQPLALRGWDVSSAFCSGLSSPPRHRERCQADEMARLSCIVCLFQAAPFFCHS